MRSTINTIGYEGKDINQFIDELLLNKVDTLIDTRIRAGGRKIDFCKKNLSNYLQNKGIHYHHLRELGTPQYLMQIMKIKGTYSMDEYSLYLDSQENVLENAIAIAKTHNVAIMCFEKNYETCHRSVIAERLSIILNKNVNHI